jgi:hypothetical protein
MVGLFLQLRLSVPLLKRVAKSPQDRQRRKRREASRKRLPTLCMQKMLSDGGRRTKYCMYMLSELVGMSVTGGRGLNNHCATGAQNFCPSLWSPL